MTHIIHWGEESDYLIENLGTNLSIINKTNILQEGL